MHPLDQGAGRSLAGDRGSAESTHDDQQSAYVLGGEQGETRGPRTPEQIAAACTSGELRALTDHLIALREVQRRVAAERATWPIVGSIAIDAWHDRDGQTCGEMQASAEPLPTAGQSLVARVVVRRGTQKQQAVRLLRDVAQWIERDDYWDGHMRNAEALETAHRDDDQDFPF